MTNEGYLQIKIRELIEEVENLNKQISIHKEEIIQVKNEFESALNDKLKTFKPLLDASDKIVLCQTSNMNYLHNELVKQSEELRVYVKTEMKRIATDSQNSMREWTQNAGEKFNTQIIDAIKCMNFRINALVDTLNKKLGWSLSHKIVEQSINE